MSAPYLELLFCCDRLTTVSLLNGPSMNGNDSKRRKICPHCTQSISYSAYLSHKARYYDNQSSQWTLDLVEGADRASDGSFLQSDTDSEDATDWNDELSMEPQSDTSTDLESECEDQDYEVLEVL